MDYLLKKKCHPGRKDNIEMVLLREQQASKLFKKSEEYQKKILEEEHNYELKVAQVEAGLIPKSALDKMGWMYDNATKYDKDKKIQGQNTSLNFCSKQNYEKNQSQAIVTEDYTNTVCENFTLIHEDPLFKIQQEELKMRQKLMSNYTDTKIVIQKQVSNSKEGYYDKDLIEKSQKFKKKKDHKNVQKGYSSKDQQENSKFEEKSRSRSSKTKKAEKRQSKKKQRRHQSPSSSKETAFKLSKSNSPVLRQKEMKQKESDIAKSMKQNQINRDSCSKSNSPESKLKQEQFEKYLLKKVGNILVRGNDGVLRPDFSIMKRKFRNNLKPEEKLQMTEQERRDMLQEMQENAKKISDQRIQEFQSDYCEQDKKIEELHNKQNNPIFIQSINQEIYSGQKGINALADRVSIHQNRFARNLEEVNTFK
ncbi:hypothetical protein ABPG74_004855 [Tetrahymena malaccensis]